MVRVLVSATITIGLLILCFGVLTYGHGIGLLVQPILLILILIVMVGFTAAAGRLGVWRAIFGDLRRCGSEIVIPVARGSDELRPHYCRRLAALRAGETTAQIAGILGCILALIATFGSIAEPPAVLGHYIGTSLLSLLYGLLIAHGVLAPAGARLADLYDSELQALEEREARP